MPFLGRNRSNWPCRVGPFLPWWLHCADVPRDGCVPHPRVCLRPLACPSLRSKVCLCKRRDWPECSDIVGCAEQVQSSVYVCILCALMKNNNNIMDPDTFRKLKKDFWHIGVSLFCLLWLRLRFAAGGYAGSLFLFANRGEQASACVIPRGFKTHV